MTSLSLRIAILLFLSSACIAAPTNLSMIMDEYTSNQEITIALDADNATMCQLSNNGSEYENTSSSFPVDQSWELTSGDGAKIIYFRCTDGENWTTPVTGEIILDTTSPVADTFDPEDETVSDTTPAISAHLSDPNESSGIDESSIEMFVDGDLVEHEFSSGEVSYTGSSEMDCGSHDVSLEFSDVVGNNASFSWDFMISTGISFNDESPGDGSFLTDERPDISIEIDDEGAGVDEDTLELVVDGTDVTEDAEFSDDEITYSPEEDLDEGNITVELELSDTAGERTDFTWSFIIDSSNPSISSPLPESGSTVSAISQISVFLDDDISGIDSSTIEMEIDGNDVTEDVDFDDGHLVFEYVDGMTEDSYEVDVYVEDKAGNDESYYWSFTLDMPEPSLSSKVPEPDSVISDSRPGISAKITSSAGMTIDQSSIRMHIDGDEVIPDKKDRIISYTPGNDLEDGEHTVHVMVAYEEGGDCDVEWDFTIDTTPPESVTDLAVSLEENKSRLTWAGPSDAKGYELYVSETEPESLSDMFSTGTTPTANYSHDGDKRYYFAVVAYDDSGNEAEPAYGQNCGDYEDGWSDFECCWDHQCEGECDRKSNACIPLEEESNLSKSDAADMIDEANAAISEAASDSRNVDNAKEKIQQAESAYNLGDYNQAHELALLAKELAEAAEPAVVKVEGKKPNPCCPSLLILPIIVFSFYMSKKASGGI